MKVNGFGFKTIEIAVMMGCLIACDTPSTLLFNDVPTYCISSECGSVKITGTTLVSDNITLFFTGDFVINIDSLKMRFNNIPIENVDMIHRNKLLKEVNKMIEIEECDTISLIIRNTYPLKYGKCSFAEIIPSSFILCNGTPIITKLIKIKKH